MIKTNKRAIMIFDEVVVVKFPTLSIEDLLYVVPRKIRALWARITKNTD